jgi:Zn-dependent alcohol dehydrogenase
VLGLAGMTGPTTRPRHPGGRQPIQHRAVTRDDTVAVIGCGGVGDAAIAGAALVGAKKIVTIPKRSRPGQCSGMLLKLQRRRVVNQSESGDAR